MHCSAEAGKNAKGQREMMVVEGILLWSNLPTQSLQAPSGKDLLRLAVEMAMLAPPFKGLNICQVGQKSGCRCSELVVFREPIFSSALAALVSHLLVKDDGDDEKEGRDKGEAETNLKDASKRATLDEAMWSFGFSEHYAPPHWQLLRPPWPQSTGC
ncbi:unnamed protein product, partial [Symbiodinium microadriaticum]